MAGRISARAEKLSARIDKLEASAEATESSQVSEHYQRCAKVLASLVLLKNGEMSRGDAVANMLAVGLSQSDTDRYLSISFNAARDELMAARAGELP